MENDSLKKAAEFWDNLELTNIEDKSFETKDGSQVGCISLTYSPIEKEKTEDIEHEVIQPKQLPNSTNKD